MPDLLHEEAAEAAFVKAWLEGLEASALAPPQLILLFERSTGVLWRRAEFTLGEVTLGAIVERVVHTAAETHPVLSMLTVDKSGLHFDGFRQSAAQQAGLLEAITLVLVEFLTVLGHLTDEILTPGLHAELAKVTLHPAPPGDGEMGRGARR